MTYIIECHPGTSLADVEIRYPGSVAQVDSKNFSVTVSDEDTEDVEGLLEELEEVISFEREEDD